MKFKRDEAGNGRLARGFIRCNTPISRLIYQSVKLGHSRASGPSLVTPSRAASVRCFPSPTPSTTYGTSSRLRALVAPAHASRYGAVAAVQCGFHLGASR